MALIKTFESFQESINLRVFIANPNAEYFISKSGKFNHHDGVYESAEELKHILESDGYSSPADFLVLDSLIEATPNGGSGKHLKVTYDGHEPSNGGTEIFVTINGHKYGYSQKEGDLDIADIARKFSKMLKFSNGKAITWLKKHTELSSGSKSTEADDTKGIQESFDMLKEQHGDHLEHYMFFGNLKTIKRNIDRILALDPSEIDKIIHNGHDWAEDHIATSKDDIEEVCDFLCNQLESKIETEE